MTSASKFVTMVAGLLFAAASFAQAPAAAPAGTTGLCKDGTYTSAANKKGACSSHKGVQTWYASESGTAASAATPAAPATAKPAASAPTTPAAPAAPAARPAPPTTPAPAATAAGGAGQVWVNTKSKVYHCPGDRWYGKTKDGEYMSEADATAKGNRPDHGKTCK